MKKLVSLVLGLACASGIASAETPEEEFEYKELPAIGQFHPEFELRTREQAGEHIAEKSNRVPTTRRGGRRVRPPPPLDYSLPQTMGATSLNFEINNSNMHYRYWSVSELFDDMSNHGLRAAKLWLDTDPFLGAGTSETVENDMDFAWTHPDIDLVVLRLMNENYSIREYGCDSDGRIHGTSFANEPTYEIATKFYDLYHDQDKVIIIGDWEQDWQVRGQRCGGTDELGRFKYPWHDADPWYSTKCIDECVEAGLGDENFCHDDCGKQLVRQRFEYVRDLLERRQEAIERARREAMEKYPDLKLRVFHAVTVNKYPANMNASDYGFNVSADIIPYLKHKPDFIALSFWRRSVPITDALEYIHEVTGYPYSRIFIDELGEHRTDEQYDRIMTESLNAKALGVGPIFIWNLKQTYWECKDEEKTDCKNYGLWEQLPGELGPTFGDPRPGYYAVQDLLKLEKEESFKKDNSTLLNENRLLATHK